MRPIMKDFRSVVGVTGRTPKRSLPNHLRNSFVQFYMNTAPTNEELGHTMMRVTGHTTRTFLTTAVSPGNGDCSTISVCGGRGPREGVTE
jgi:hypothetical protein